MIRALQVNNPANVAVELREALSLFGIYSEVIETYPSPLKSDVDTRYVVTKKDDVMDKVAWFALLSNKIRHFDIIHFHCGITRPTYYLARLARIMKKRVVAHYHGSDLREGEGDRYKHLAHLKIIVSPALKEYCEDGVYLPNPYIVPRKRISRPDPPPLKVVHAHGRDDPYKLFIKGSKTIREAMEGLENRGIKFVEVSQTSHEDALKIYEKCHVAIDQLLLADYGMFAIECMARELPVIGYVDRRFRPQVPIINLKEGLTPENELELAAELREKVLWLSENPEEIREWGRKGKEYVLQEHNPRKIGERLAELYTELL